MARAMSSTFLSDERHVVFAAGVSNSGCRDAREFAREKARLRDAIDRLAPQQTLVYFGTCSVCDPSLQQSDYVAHKHRMEAMVSACTRYLILRLPQVAGHTPNPHTLLNHLYSRVSRSERFELWRAATRNVIDVDDVAEIATRLLHDTDLSNQVVNVASPQAHSMLEIVGEMEAAVGKPALYDLVDRGIAYDIDISPIGGIVASMAGRFERGYLGGVVRKYYHRGRTDL